ncbi:MAG: aminotransferase class IV [Bacteroidota bacterium]
MNKPFVIINDSFLPEDKAALLVSDLAIQRGYGIFDFLRTINGKFIFADDHLDRFFHSASQMRLETGKTKDQLKELLTELVSKNNIPDSGIRITLTGGYSEDGYALAKPNMVISQKPLIVPEDNSADGIRLISYEHQRQLPDVKTIDYIMAIWLRSYISQNNADDVLYHRAGRVSEIPRSNFFIVTYDDKVVTAGHNILKGIIRKQVLKISGSRFDTEEKEIFLDDIRNAKEAFVTSTTKQVLPVLQVDGQQIGKGKPGEITMWLKEQLIRLVYE